MNMPTRICKCGSKNVWAICKCRHVFKTGFTTCPVCKVTHATQIYKCLSCAEKDIKRAEKILVKELSYEQLEKFNKFCRNLKILILMKASK